MSAVGRQLSANRTLMPELGFSIENAEAASHAAVPALRFALRIAAPAGPPIRSILLDVQIQIAARQRGYSSPEEALLEELFGTSERWGTTLRTLPWTRTTIVVPPFEGASDIELFIPCSYDLEVAGSRYFAALAEGVVPLEFLFSGSVFFTTPQGTLQTTRIASECEATYRLPVGTWREAMDRHFPGSAWLRLSRARFEALAAYKARHAYVSWDATVDALLEGSERDGR